jgi:hypothetical protein
MYDTALGFNSSRIAFSVLRRPEFMKYSMFSAIPVSISNGSNKFQSNCSWEDDIRSPISLYSLTVSGNFATYTRYKIS